MRLVLVLAFVLAPFNCGGNVNRADAFAKDGALDLTHHDFKLVPIIALNGEWQFFSSALVATPAAAAQLNAVNRSVPQTWVGDGHGTYRLRVKLPPSATDFSVHMQAQLSAYDVVVDGSVRAASGQPAASRADTLPATKPLTFNLRAGAEHEVFLRIANYHHRKGGLFKKILLGPADAMAAEIDSMRLTDLLLAGVLLMAAAYHFFVYLFRRQNFPELFFAATCLAILIRMLTTGEKTLLLLWPDAPFSFYTMAEYLSYFWGIPLALSFFNSVYPETVPRLILRGFYACAAIFSAVVFLTPLKIYSHTAYLYLPVMSAGVVLVFVVLLRVLWRREKYSVLLSGGFFVLAITLVNDTLNTLEIIRTVYLVQFGFLAVVLCYSAVLARRFAEALNNSERASGQLREANESLEARVQERTSELQKAKNIAEAANRQKDYFLSLVSHDLRSPLSGIFGTLQILQANASSDATKKRMLEASERSAQRMLRIVDTLLQLHRVNYGERREHEEFFPSQVVAGLLLEISDQANDRQIRLISKLAQDWQIRTNVHLFRHVVSNLVSNALKFSPPGKAITIFKPEETPLSICVRDEGVGMEAEKTEAINRGQPIKPTAGVASELGSGLALAICREMLANGGGSLTVTSEPGKGSTFTVVFPGNIVAG